MWEVSLYSKLTPAFIVCRREYGHSDWWDLIFLCHFHWHSSFHIIIRDAEHPVLGGGRGFVGFFTLYGCEENRPEAAGFLKVDCVWNLS